MSDFERKTMTRKIQMLKDLPLPARSTTSVLSLFKKNRLSEFETSMTLEHGSVFFAQLIRFLIHEKLIDPAEIPSPREALNLLGGERTANLLQSLPLLDSFEEAEHRELEHASSCCILVRHILRDNHLHMPHLVAAVRFHDIGHNVFRLISPKKYGLVNAAEEDSRMSRRRLEEELISMTHSEAGALLLEHWGFPDSVWKPVLYHHDEDTPKEYAFENAVLQFVDWIDTVAREKRVDVPLRTILSPAGLDALDPAPWIAIQKRVIRMNEMRYRKFCEKMFFLLKCEKL